MPGYITTLASSVRGDLDLRRAPTRAKAFEAARDPAIGCLAREAERGWLHNEVVGKGRGGSVSTMMQPHQVFSASEQLHLADAGERPGLSRLRRLNLGRMQVDLHWTAGPQSKVALLSKHRRDV